MPGERPVPGGLPHLVRRIDHRRRQSVQPGHRHHHDPVPQQPGRRSRLGLAAEDRGFESLFFPEHTHIPTSRESPYPGGGDLPMEYSHTLDPFVAFGAIAATTEKIKLATGIALIVERDPIMLAKEVATLDQLSNGRVMLGIGGGGNREEMRNHGTEPSSRWLLGLERVEAKQA
ncbi:MAG: LLM class flavin-dependent oxidoreductase, partial [Actinobacteria bacterium]|nr:LLM class flavin-dependent oxidoreductase [Actinomycetota bacterium]